MGTSFTPAASKLCLPSSRFTFNFIYYSICTIPVFAASSLGWRRGPVISLKHFGVDNKMFTLGSDVELRFPAQQFNSVFAIFSLERPKTPQNAQNFQTLRSSAPWRIQKILEKRKHIESCKL
ncbi:Hypothetical_protein [Hexamita inflata]|uniref:Hypothetical_protein n=1 Tax=Hexamita inflata TaxID=28002 RepID=A0AA86URR4_9EUKA|nr:Hypothetical protein HINF_LOCUS49681 [Hexamita inflata]